VYSLFCRRLSYSNFGVTLLSAPLGLRLHLPLTGNPCSECTSTYRYLLVSEFTCTYWHRLAGIPGSLSENVTGSLIFVFNFKIIHLVLNCKEQTAVGSHPLGDPEVTSQSRDVMTWRWGQWPCCPVWLRKHIGVNSN